jgi:hypothetical protein
MYSSTLSLTSALDGVGNQCHAPAALPAGLTLYPLYRRLGGLQGQYGRARKISAPPGFVPGLFKPVQCSYTGYAIPANCIFPSALHILCDFTHDSIHLIKLPQKVICIMSKLRTCIDKHCMAAFPCPARDIWVEVINLALQAG